MESKTIFVILLVGALGIAAAVAGFVAEATKVKRSQPKLVYVGLEPVCEYPSSPAIGLAIAATVALVIARSIITSTTGGCCSCCQPIPTGPKFARVCIVMSCCYPICCGCKIKQSEGCGERYEWCVRSGFFAGAGIMGLVSVLLGLYVLARRHAAETPCADLELEKPPTTDRKNVGTI